MKKILMVVAGLLVVLVGVVLIRGLLFTAQAPTAQALALPADTAALQRLGAAVRIRTVSYADLGQRDSQAFLQLHAHLRQCYPRVHQAMRLERVAGYSLLYTWVGSDRSAQPILLLGHQDVVPVEQATRVQWAQDPFGGEVAEGYLYGRGTLDDKVNIYGLFEAAEALLAAGHVPKRTVYFAFGHDEEAGGSGAQAIAALLKQRGVRAQFVLDEGMIVGQGFLPVAGPIAFVGLAEKGYASFVLTAKGVGGHSSYPKPDNAIAKLAAAVQRVNARQLPTRLSPPIAGLLAAVGPHMGLASRLAMANLWLSEGFVLGQFSQNNITNAMVRTTTAPTILVAGEKDNVVPNVASATLNFRLLPGDAIADVQRHLQAVVNDSSISIALLPGANEATPVSSSSSAAYATLCQAISTTFPECIIAPSLVVAATDARHYVGVADDVYRFMPLRLTPDDTPRIHGINERINALHYSEVIHFYKTLLTLATQQ